MGEGASGLQQHNAVTPCGKTEGNGHQPETAAPTYLRDVSASLLGSFHTVCLPLLLLRTLSHCSRMSSSGTLSHSPCRSHWSFWCSPAAPFMPSLHLYCLFLFLLLSPPPSLLISTFVEPFPLSLHALVSFFRRAGRKEGMYNQRCFTGLHSSLCFYR